MHQGGPGGAPLLQLLIFQLGPNQTKLRTSQQSSATCRSDTHTRPSAPFDAVSSSTRTAQRHQVFSSWSLSSNHFISNFDCALPCITIGLVLPLPAPSLHQLRIPSIEQPQSRHNHVRIVPSQPQSFHCSPSFGRNETQRQPCIASAQSLRLLPAPSSQGPPVYHRNKHQPLLISALLCIDQTTKHHDGWSS